MNNIALVCLMLFPLLAMCFPIMRGHRIWNVGCICATFLASGYLMLEYYSPLFDWRYDLVANFTLRYTIDYFALQFLVLLTGLWILAAIYAWSYLKAITHPRPLFFMFFYNLSVVAAMLTAMSGNLQTMFIHYELLTLCTTPLIAELGTAHAERSLKVYMGYLLFASLALFLPAVIMIHNYVGHTDFTAGGILFTALPKSTAIILFMMLLYGTAKTALMPAHGWLPAAMVAYHPVSALLHAVAVVNIGLFCMCRVVTHIFGIGYLNEIFAGLHYAVLIAPVFTVLAASVIALRQDTVKRMLAYSTVSQLSMVLVALLSFTPNALSVAFIFMAIHSINKLGLFFCAGNIYVMTRYSKLSEFVGLAKVVPHTAICFVILGLSLIGVPPLAGFWAKYAVIIEGVSLLQNQSIAGWLIFLVIIVGSLFTAWYIVSMLIRLYDEQSYKSAELAWQQDLQITKNHTALITMKSVTYVVAACSIIAPLFLVL